MEFIFPVIFGFSCIFVFFFYINGYFDLLLLLIKNLQLIRKTIRELNITPDMLNQFASIISNDNSKPKNETYISKTGKCIHIYYIYEGKEYRLTVPYSGLFSVDMIQYQVDAIYENGDYLTITQQSGIPYLISSNDLKCKKIKAINHETDVYHEYIDDKIPNFCEEISDV